ncbi:MAG: bifunctional (p)ppGpp synthetase/guanosine-3',5'-bis(diphosphate) 3'-pyrophosphohydrolase [Desulfohalobiaceae bacterium]|nr:bifunctional (p)ppGpp synthetase/guanosine-3',5'-bis(diphosphate) 3'-pyrophosphohydrolase [Desulfohalobiaceae bacterium]
MIRINEIIEKASQYLGEADTSLIQKAYVFSAAKHTGQMRLSGEPYLSHPLEVANILVDLHLDTEAIVAGLLHDTIEDSGVSIEELKQDFGDKIAGIVDGVTKIGQVTFDTREEAQAENIRKMILAMAKDIRVILVKLADRLHNMKTLGFQKSFKQKLIARETLDIYSPLANRLGLYRLKVELDDLSLQHLKPDVYQHIAGGISQHKTLGKEYVDQVIGMLQDLMQKNRIEGRVNGRQKHIYSIYQKMLKQNLDFDQVYDLIAFRVIVKTVRDCYAMLGLVHSIWTPVPGRFKDYISLPKGNMYQSIHTTVLGPGGEHVEIQIRTEEMHLVAEFGVAAHWKYKEGGPVKTKDEERFVWLRHILDWEHELKDPQEFMASLKVDLFEDEVYVFTPRGKVLDLPSGATPVDFAYSIHTEVGQHCSGAKVNGRLVSLDTQLKNGDQVEIITDPKRNPSRDWLRFVKTAKARTRIKHWIRTQERERSISLAKEMLEKEGRRIGINFNKELKQGSLEKVTSDFSYKKVDDLLSAVGYARITPKQVLHKLRPKEIQTEEKKGRPEEKKAKPQKTVRKKEPAETKKIIKEGVSIKGVDDVMIRFANCCQPVPGDPIVGYISRGKGVVVHTADCKNVMQFSSYRLINVSWDGEAEAVYPATIKVVCRNQKGVLADISSLLTSEDVNIQSGHFYSNIEGKTEIYLHIEVNDSTHLYRMLEHLSLLDPVQEAYRTTSKN